ncbi:hypothetical protein HYH03_008731 [Edaphochlamys debaryana]|uniref:Misato Segment II tubulin-like domain-containing protein n=1 Tax=Edaphochlamys debaryana TaxID=47281 RepID=A0A835XZD7_9CHLO|nr:hypothetical protein HYH03_008731 [Edaphochlamys debaryana]|eukprot:KAG2493068.1 hypothetical protein HYH03_008731 [Edaphochlamys debaryana]
MPKEIVTLSFGSYASFVSAHYWNLQDEAAGYSGREGWADYAACVDHDVLFACSEGRNGALTYRPRALLVDIAGSSGGVSFRPDEGAAAAAAAAASAAPSWSGRVEVHRSAPVGRSAFVEALEEAEEGGWEEDEEAAARQQAALEAAARQLDEGGGGEGGPAPAPASASPSAGAGAAGRGVRHWTDYCKVVFHPRSVLALPGSWSSPLEHSLGGGWGAAAELLGGGGGLLLGEGGGGGGGALEELLDSLRWQGEACDSLAGFQLFVDDLTGFGPLAAAALAEAAQEYSGRPAVLFALRQPGQGGAQGSLPGTSVSTAMMTARAREDLSEALAAVRLCELASLLVPLAAPAPACLPALAYDPAAPFHSAALLAAAVDTALLPTRSTAAPSPLGEALGGTDLRSLTRLLAPGGPGGRAAPLAALHLGFPCASLPADPTALQRQLDTRLRPPHGGLGAGAGTAGAAAGGEAGKEAALRADALYGRTAQLDLGSLASLTPGIGGRDDPLSDVGCSRAESYCIRGGRTDAGPASTSSALEALDALLLQRRHRMCVRHRAAAPMPLAVPLPFPAIFGPTVTTHGAVQAAGFGPEPGPGGPRGAAAGPGVGTGAGERWEGAQPASLGGGGARAGAGARGRGGAAVHSVPVLTRLHAGAEFQGWMAGVQRRWERAAGSAAGRAVLDAWDIGRDDADHVGAHLREMAAAYAEDGEDEL